MRKHVARAAWREALVLSIAAVTLAQGAGCQRTTARAAAPRRSKPPSSKASVARGQELVAANHCTRCHTINGKGGKKGPNLNRVAPRLSTQAIEKQVHNGGGGMPAFKGIPKEDLNALAAYLRSLK